MLEKILTLIVTKILDWAFAALSKYFNRKQKQAEKDAEIDDKVESLEIRRKAAIERMKNALDKGFDGTLVTEEQVKELKDAGRALIYSTYN